MVKCDIVRILSMSKYAYLPDLITLLPPGAQIKGGEVIKVS